MLPTGIARIDTLWNDASAAPIARGEPDAEAVGALQDLLIGHGARLPGILGTARGSYGPATESAVSAFQTARGLPATGRVDQATLRALAAARAPSPIAARGYLALVLDTAWSGFNRLVALTAQFEAAGKFTARNRNTDRAGLSFGIIQWAQKPGRLSEIVRAFQRDQPARFVEVFGGGDAQLAAGLLAHVAKPRGGVDAAGRTTDPRYDLVDDTWNARFVEAGRDQVWQRTQLRQAVAAYRISCDAIRAAAPAARSERAVAFLLDVANQHGDGGMRSICSACARPGMDEAAFLQAAEDESVRRLKAQFGDGSAEMRSTRSRREMFRTSKLLADTAFSDT